MLLLLIVLEKNVELEQKDMTYRKLLETSLLRRKCFNKTQ